MILIIMIISPILTKNTIFESPSPKDAYILHDIQYSLANKKSSLLQQKFFCIVRDYSDLPTYLSIFIAHLCFIYLTPFFS